MALLHMTRRSVATVTTGCQADMGQGGQMLRQRATAIHTSGAHRCATGNDSELARREFLRLAAGAAALAALPRAARAQSYPARAVRVIVGLAAGGGQDIVARLMGQWLSERLGRQFIVENRPGASGNLALEAVAGAAPDGYTLALL